MSRDAERSSVGGLSIRPVDFAPTSSITFLEPRSIEGNLDSRRRLAFQTFFPEVDQYEAVR